MDDDELELLGTCAAIEALESVNKSTWNAVERTLFEYARQAAKLARREREQRNKFQQSADGRLACMNYQGVN